MVVFVLSVHLKLDGLWNDYDDDEIWRILINTGWE